MTESDNGSPLAPLPVRPVTRLAFLGTPHLAAEVLESLIDEGLEIAVVVTRPDKRRGRGSSLAPSPVKELAQRHGLKVVHDIDDLVREHHVNPIQLGVVVAFGAIIKAHVLAEIPMVNLHVSLLPRWRGAAPIERAILAGDPVTGVCLMQVEHGLDTGGIIASRSVPIGETTTAQELGRELMRDGTLLLLEALRSGVFTCTPQAGEPTYAAKIQTDERRIDWSESGEMVSRRVRIGGAWTQFRGRRLKIIRAVLSSVSVPMARIELHENDLLVGCGQGSIRLLEVQPEGRGRLEALEWMRGVRLQADEHFGER